ncbi:MAG: D-alanine--D-alanine ligase, partial [bacterium]|nr:D-alanine--D-alanine ligase [bacterium]
MKLLFHKITHWEYWPFQIVYIPIYFLWAFYSLKAKSIFFFNAANPTIKNGGFMMESKKAIYD